MRGRIVNEEDQMFPRINSLFVIQHVEPYKYTRILRIILISLFHVSSARFTPVATLFLRVIFHSLSMLEHKTHRVTGAPDIT